MRLCTKGKEKQFIKTPYVVPPKLRLEKFKFFIASLSARARKHNENSVNSHSDVYPGLTQGHLKSRFSSAQLLYVHTSFNEEWKNELANLASFRAV